MALRDFLKSPRSTSMSSTGYAKLHARWLASSVVAEESLGRKVLYLCCGGLLGFFGPVLAVSLSAPNPLLIERTIPASLFAVEVSDLPLEAQPPIVQAIDEEIFHQQTVLMDYIQEEYRIAPLGAERLVSAAYSASFQYDVDPVIVLSIMAVESRFNPFAGSIMGAQGLMQIMPEAHPEKVARIEEEGLNILNPEANIREGAMVLREYLDRHKNNLTLALQQYNGNVSDAKRRYSGRVFAVESRLREALNERASVRSQEPPQLASAPTRNRRG